MPESLNILLVEDSESDAKLVVRVIERAGHQVQCQRVETADEMRDALGRGRYDLVISDWSLPTFNAPAALALMQGMGVELPFIIVSGTIGEESAVEAMRAGANDYVLKDKLARLVPAVERELREHAARRAAAQALAQSEAALRRSEEAFRQAQKMEAVGRLAGGVAHDFNNLLSVILSYAGMMMNELDASDPMLADLREIELAGQRAATLTQQLLAFSRRQMMQPSVVNLNQLVSGVERMLRRVIGEDIELTFVQSSTIGQVRVDPVQMQQVLMNLAVNARDAMPDGGKLTIETASIVADDAFAAANVGMAPGRYIALAVSDTGIGMDKETQARIFEPFFTTKEQGKGTGLGLSTVFGIVQQSGGTVSVYSELGHGTCFKLYLPELDALAVPFELEAETAQLDQAALGGSETVLVVEDDESVRALSCTILRRHGYHVLESQSAGDAVLICEQHPATIHLLLSDVIMPRISGFQLAQRLRALRPQMKTLFMSGYTDASILQQGLIDSDVEFIQKPITPASLARRVRDVLDARRKRTRG